ncbi:MAG: hypothetical protein AAB785_02190 [Patescibacteria group bacterium]
MNGWYWFLVCLLSSGLYLLLMIVLGEDKHWTLRPLSISRDLADIAVELPGLKKLIGLALYIVFIGLFLYAEILTLCLLLLCFIVNRFDPQLSPSTCDPPSPPQ